MQQIKLNRLHGSSQIVEPGKINQSIVKLGSIKGQSMVKRGRVNKSLGSIFGKPQVNQSPASGQ